MRARCRRGSLEAISPPAMQALRRRQSRRGLRKSELSTARQAPIGAGKAPTNQVLTGLALFLTLFVMSPVVNRIRVMRIVP